MYRQEVVTPLLQTLLIMAAEHTEVLLAADTEHCPAAVRSFVKRAKAHFDVSKVPAGELHPECRLARVVLLRLRKLPD